MGKLDDVSDDELRRGLRETDRAKPATRAMIALAYKDGVAVSTLSERYGIPVSTLYAWLDRFESRPLATALADDSRPGRPTKLDEHQRKTLESTLEASPTAVGYDTPTWTATLVQRYVEDTYCVTYSTGHIRAEFGDYLGGDT